MGISTPVPDPEHPEVADFRRRLDDELSEHGALAGFADGEAFHRIDDL
jgi:hypothetical protein